MDRSEELLQKITQLEKRIGELELAARSVEAAGFDIWENNFVTGEVSGTAYRIFESIGYPKDELPKNLEETYSYVNPDDLKLAMGLIQDHFDGKTPNYQAEMRVRAKDGSWVWIGNYGKVVERDREGRVTRFCGVTFNINQRRIVEEALVEQNRELREAVEQIKILQGIIPICCNCKKVRDDKGYWEQVEEYLEHYSGAKFSHSICPDCAKKLYPNLTNLSEEKEEKKEKENKS